MRFFPIALFAAGWSGVFFVLALLVAHWHDHTPSPFAWAPLFLLGGLWLGGLAGAFWIHRQDKALALASNDIQRLQFALEVSGDGIWDWDLLGGRITYLSGTRSNLGRELCRITRTAEEWNARVHPEDLPQVVRDYETFLSGQSPIFQSEFRFLDEQGEYQWVLARGGATDRTADDRPARIIGTHTDISDRRQSEQAYRMLFESMLDGFALHEVITDEAGEAVDYRFLAVNPAFERLTRLPAAAVIGRTAREIFPDLESIWVEDYGRVARSGEGVRFERYFPGLRKYFEIVAFCTRPGQFACIFQDVTERRLAENALRESEERFAQIFQTIPDCIGINRTDGTFIEVNRGFTRLMGYSREEVLGQSSLDLGIWVEPRQRAELLERVCREGMASEHPCLMRRHDGRTIEALASAAPISLQDETHLLIIVRDVTERMRLEEQVRQSQKMEAIGTLAGGIAHDFNNLLTGILGYASLLRIEMAPGSDAYEAASTIEKAAESAAELTRKLLGFARRGKFLCIPVDVHAVIGEAVALLSRTIDKKIVLVQHHHAEQATVLGDPSQLQQVILNLALNARDAMPKGGELRFETETQHFSAHDAAQQTTPLPCHALVLSVIDSGGGIPEEIRERIFEPFFTTKESGKGTGMGLAMVYGIVKNHGGAIKVESQLGRGSCFRIYLPLQEVPAILPAPGEDLDRPLRCGAGRILLLDDEEIVLHLGESMLRRLGYEVEPFSSPLRAIEFYSTHATRIDLVILDMAMPELDGHETYLQLKRINPSVRAILSSGYDRDGKAQAILDAGVLDFLQKPYRLEQLGEAVAQVLAAKA